MPDHGGFAAAVTIREKTLKTALLAAYVNSGSFPKMVDVPFLFGGPPKISANIFLGVPDINCEGTTGKDDTEGRLVLKLPVWGPVRVTIDSVDHVVGVAGELEVAVPPVFYPGQKLLLRPSNDLIEVRSWTASITTTDAPADVASYVVGDQFRVRLQTTIQETLGTANFDPPSIDVGYFGALATLATSVEARVREGVLLLGLNVADNTDHESIVGSADILADFAGSNDVAAAVNEAAMSLVFDNLRARMASEIHNNGATLDRFSVKPAAGFFEVSGAARNSKGTANFSFRLVPSLFHTRQGGHFGSLREMPLTVHSRTWAALEFRVEGVDVDVDRAWWVVVLDIASVVLTAGLVTLYIESQVSAAAEAFRGGIESARTGASSARVRRTIAPPGGVSVRVGVDQFDITPDGSYTGISIRPTPTPAALLGPTVVPITYANEPLRYLMKLPSGVLEDDPALRIHWTLEDRTNGVTLVEQDNAAAGWLRFEFLPASFPGVSDFGLTARLYRRLGPRVTELGAESVNLHIREALPPAAYIRWTSQVSNPQFAIDEATDEWAYRGEVERHRWSEWHRTDNPCLAVKAPHRYRVPETVDRLPFPLLRLENHRKRMCPYCFYGGPAGVNTTL